MGILTVFQTLQNGKVLIQRQAVTLVARSPLHGFVIRMIFESMERLQSWLQLTYIKASSEVLAHPAHTAFHRTRNGNKMLSHGLCE